MTSDAKHLVISATGRLQEVAEEVAHSLHAAGAATVIQFRRKTLRSVGGTDPHTDSYKRLDKLAKRHCSQGWEESAILGRLTKTAVGEIMALSGYSDWSDYVSCLSPADIRDDSEDCTAFAHPITTPAIAWIACGQTWDYQRFYLEHTAIIRRLTSDSPSTLSLTTFLGHAYFGLNEHGTGVLTTNLRSPDVQMGLPFSSLIFRSLLESTSAEEATANIVRGPRMAAHSYIAVDATGAAFAIEASASHADVRPLPPNEIYVHANHAVFPTLKSCSLDYSASSRSRASQLLEQLGPAPPGSDVASLTAAFSDHNAPVCRHADDPTASSTIGAIAIRPKARTMLVLHGNPCMSSFHEYSL